MSKQLNPDMVKDVLDFHRKFHQYVGDLPHWPPFDILRMRFRLVNEEWAEFNTAIAGEDIDQIADAVGDLIYVLLGMTNAMGVDMRPVWTAIQRSNMAKENGGEREDGKILKPEGWTPPPIKMILALQSEDWHSRVYEPEEETPADA
jgi:predicted HAD superfamily Cof-like phosphohydrolase